MSSNQQADPALWLAKQQIAELQHLYGVATDLIGEGRDETVAEGRAIYHRIFTPEAQIGAAGVDPQIGPDAWTDLVHTALAQYSATQHLIGTQRVTVQALPDEQGNGGHGTMTSYLQAWHVQPDSNMWTFVGSYQSEVVHSPGTGWQMASMLLKATAEDFRQIQPRPE